MAEAFVAKQSPFLAVNQLFILFIGRPAVGISSNIDYRSSYRRLNQYSSEL